MVGPRAVLLSFCIEPYCADGNERRAPAKEPLVWTVAQDLASRLESLTSGTGNAVASC